MPEDGRTSVYADDVGMPTTGTTSRLLVLSSMFRALQIYQKYVCSNKYVEIHIIINIQ